MEEETLIVKKPIDPDGGYAYTLRDMMGDYSVAAVVDCLSKLCERHANFGEDHKLKGEDKIKAKQYAFDQRELERATQRILRFGSGSGCK